MIPTAPGFYAVKRPYWSEPMIYELMEDGRWKRSDSGYIQPYDESWDSDAKFIGPLNF